MTRAAWIAGGLALAAHAPLALVLLAAEPVRDASAAPRAAASATIDLTAWRPRPVPHPRAGRRAGTSPAPRASRRNHEGRSSGTSSGPTELRDDRQRITERAAEETPSARGVAISEEVSARGAELVQVSGTGTGTGTGSGSGSGSGSAQARTFQQNEVDVAPRRLSGSDPVYPRLDALAGREGYVTLRFVVGEDGAVSSIELQEQKGPSSFVESARDAVSGWRFSPALQGGRAVACSCVQRLTFRLGGKR